MHISTKNSTQLTNKTLKKACNLRNTIAPLILHTDRGANYTSKAFNQNLKKYNIIHSYSAPGRPYDNSVCESFFKTLKHEEIYHQQYLSENEMHKSIEKYMDFYNSKRPHAFINYKTPNAFEQEYSIKNPDEIPIENI